MSEKLQELQLQMQELKKQIKQEKKLQKTEPDLRERKRIIFTYTDESSLEYKTINTFKQVFNKCIEQNKINKLNEQLNKLLNILQ